MVVRVVNGWTRVKFNPYVLGCKNPITIALPGRRAAFFLQRYLSFDALAYVAS